MNKFYDLMEIVSNTIFGMLMMSFILFIGFIAYSFAQN